MFADDTNLFLSNYSIKQLYADNFELNKINDWSSRVAQLVTRLSQTPKIRGSKLT